MRTLGLSLILLAAAALAAGAACQQQGGGAAAGVSSGPGRPQTLADRSRQSAEATSRAVQNGSQRTKSTPRPAPSGPSLSALYAGALQVDAQHLVAANGARQTSCATKDLTACRSALQQVAAAAAALQRDLDANPAPACMQPADATLRSAIGLFQQGAQLGTQGIDQGSSAKLTQSRTILDQATTGLYSASDQLGRAACSVPPPNVAP
ncbi:MAG TPA: hypothetical protein VLW53_21695 [Candidatus Eisenbacteria bacterium]|nr:hypothetical protein [Candidatus Eisenbacteria bacterium]